MLLLLMYVLSCLEIILSIVLDMKERLDMGRQLEIVELVFRDGNYMGIFHVCWEDTCS